LEDLGRFLNLNIITCWRGWFTSSWKPRKSNWIKSRFWWSNLI